MPAYVGIKDVNFGKGTEDPVIQKWLPFVTTQCALEELSARGKSSAEVSDSCLTGGSAYVDEGREATWAGLVYRWTENSQTQMRTDGFIELAGWSQMRCDCPEPSDDPYSMQHSLSGWSVPTTLQRTSLQSTGTAECRQSWTAALGIRFLPTTITFFCRLTDLGCHWL